MRSHVSDVETIYQARTDRAVCVRADEGSEADVWLPLSEVEIDAPSGLFRGAVVTITAPQWLLEDKGLC